MPADRRLFDSSALVTPPAPEIDAVTNTTTGAVEEHAFEKGVMRNILADQGMSNAEAEHIVANVDWVRPAPLSRFRAGLSW